VPIAEVAVPSADCRVAAECRLASPDWPRVDFNAEGIADSNVGGGSARDAVKSSIGTCNRQSAVSIGNRQCESAIGDQKIGTHQSAIVNDQVRGT
jgi:hypothetical protein